MGLDIYFYKLKDVKFSELDKATDPYKFFKSILELQEVAYFRKVNFLVRYFWDQLHKFDYEDMCYLSNLDLLKLKERCLQVLKDHSLAEELLPTMSGFFFGSTEYDEYYFEDLEFVVEDMTEILEHAEDDVTYLFRISY